MIEARAFGVDIESIRAILERKGAVNKGRYEIRDTIYARKDGSAQISDEFLRLRVMPLNIWDEKSIVVAVKQTKLRAIGKQSYIPVRQEFDTIEEATSYIKEHLDGVYKKDFAFFRVGWQYILPNSDVVDLEIIENTHNSVEIKSETNVGIKQLAQQLNIKPEQFVKGPSVSAVRRLLNLL